MILGMEASILSRCGWRKVGFLSLLGLASAPSALASTQPQSSWTPIADDSQISVTDRGRGEMRRFRCRAFPSGNYGCLMMDSFSTFGVLYLFEATRLPPTNISPTSGFRCSIEPGSSMTQELFLTEAQQITSILRNQHGYPEQMYRNSPLWSASDANQLAAQNAVAMSAVWFDCRGAYETATRLGGIRALFTTQFRFGGQGS
jgi:hypothetical protein